jgi:Zn-finger nucleic acid-binding protein
MSGSDVEQQCPQCQLALIAIDRPELSALACHACGGTWLVRETMSRVSSTLDPASIQVGEVASELAEIPFPPHASSPPCPTCRTPMRTAIMTGTDVEVDSCSDHGTWLDRGELQTLIRELMARQPADNLPAVYASAVAQTPVGPHPITPDELRAQMIAQYGVDPSAPPKLLNSTTNTALNFGQGMATSLAVDLGISILGSLLGNSRR